MKIVPQSKPRGMILAMVMIVIVVLGMLAGGFAYSMKVETKLARNTSFEGDMEWLGRSGAEFARYFLYQDALVTAEPYDSLNQKWAGGPAGTNDVLMMLSLENNELGPGKFSIRITDMERKFNINAINASTIQIFHAGLAMCGFDPVDRSIVSDSFLDWTDPNDEPHLSGTESDGYLSNPNPGFSPYLAKNGPLGDISELLMIRGITPELFWGASGGPREADALASESSFSPFGGQGQGGLVTIFTTMSSGRVNLNTASSQVLQLLLAGDAALAQAIITTRAGFDGVDGTDDDVPFRTVGELINVPGMPPTLMQPLQQLCSTASFTFEVEVDCEIDGYKRRYAAMLRRNAANPRDIQILYFNWK